MPDSPEAELRRLLDIMAALRDPAAGCPWDITQDFDSIANSFVVDSDMRRAESLAMSYGITGTPTIVVGGEYSVDAQNDMLKVVDFVVDKVRKERKK